MSYIYDGKFSGNILVVRRTACGKTGFVQRLAVNKFLGDLIKAELISYIKLDKKREAEIQSCFDCQLDFYYLGIKKILTIFLNISKRNLPLPMKTQMKTIPILMKIMKWMLMMMFSCLVV